MSFTVDLSQFNKRIAKAHLKKQDLLDIEGPGALVLVNGMRARVPVDLGAARASINQHIIESTDTKLVDDVGPEVEYGPYLEYGTGIYAEKGDGRKTPWVYKDPHGQWHFTRGMKAQPYMRPATDEDGPQAIAAIEAALKDKING